MAIFMTGATGFLGRYIARGLLSQGESLVLLVRGANTDSARKRVHKALSAIGMSSEQLEQESRCYVCVGDIEKPNLGLNQADKAHILATCDQFIHCAAATGFSLPIERARQINVNGTRSMLQLAEERRLKGPFRRFDHISTAFVAGNRTDLVSEEDLDAPRGHKNPYEQSKFEAEQLLRTYLDRLPITIYRPSIVVGDSRTGYTADFQALYSPIKIYSSGRWRSVSAVPSTLVDLVPVDYVSDAFLAIRRHQESLGRCFHLAAGPAGSMTIQEIADMVMAFFKDRKQVIFISPNIHKFLLGPLLKHLTFGELNRTLRRLEPFIPYFNHLPQFDTSNCTELLAGTDIKPPKVESYIKQLLQYCLDSDWGRAA